MATDFWLQLAGLIVGFIGAMLLVFAQPATSEVHSMEGRRVMTLKSPALFHIGLLSLVLGFLLQASGMICGVAR